MNTIPAKILENIKKPLCRGKLTNIDSSETGFGLIDAGNGEGKVYCLINPKTKIVENVRFLSYGKLETISILDLFCEQIKNSHIEAACALDAKYLKLKADEKFESDYLQLEYFSFLKSIQENLLNAVPNMVITPAPEKGKEMYRRKDKKDMDEHDLKWLPLTAPEKITLCESVIIETLKTKTDLATSDVKLYNVQKDLQVIIEYDDNVEISKRALVTAFIQENMHSQHHPQIQVSERQT